MRRTSNRVTGLRKKGSSGTMVSKGFRKTMFELGMEDYNRRRRGLPRTKSNWKFSHLSVSEAAGSLTLTDLKLLRQARLRVTGVVFVCDLCTF